MSKVGVTLDKAALAVRPGFLTRVVGPRGAVIVLLLLTAVYPDSLAFCFWLGLWNACGLDYFTPGDLGVSLRQFHALCAALTLLGVLGLLGNLRRMAARGEQVTFGARPETPPTNPFSHR